MFDLFELEGFLAIVRKYFSALAKRRNFFFEGGWGVGVLIIAKLKLESEKYIA